MPGYDAEVTYYVTDSARHHLIVDGAHRYDAWVINGWQPLVVFAPGGTEAVAWWSDQDSSTEGLDDARDVESAWQVVLAKSDA